MRTAFWFWPSVFRPEAAEALLELATGGKPGVAQHVAPAASPFDHPDAQRRFRVMTNVEELARALDAPWEKWTVFPHPEQRELVERDYNGPARVSGSSGTGKTIVTLHRAVHLARKHPEARVLLTTFSDTLAHALRARLRRLIAGEPRLGERIEVHSLPALGLRLHQKLCGPANVVSRDELREIIRTASAAAGGHKFTLPFLLTEWEQIVDAWQLATWEAYRNVARLGRKTRLPEARRRLLWEIFGIIREVRVSMTEQDGTAAGCVSVGPGGPTPHRPLRAGQRLKPPARGVQAFHSPEKQELPG